MEAPMTDETPTFELMCELCYAETTVEPREREDWADDIESERYTVSCTDCALDGWIDVEDGEIIEFGGDIFPRPAHSSTHHGWREEPNVMLREHYHFEADDTSSDVEETTASALTFTNDEILAGWDPTVNFKCSCEHTFSSKTELAQHLNAVAQNRGEKAIN